MKYAALMLAVSACAAAPRASVVVIVSASAEWKALHAPEGERGSIAGRGMPLAGSAPEGERGSIAPMHPSPFGEWMVRRIGGADVVFFHGGYGKVSAAGSTQYAIDRWHPALIVNLGTCGAFGHGLAVGSVVLASETVIYDLVEQMGSQDEAIADYRTRLDTTAWPARLRTRVRLEPIVSGDRDLVPAELPALRDKYGAAVGDWESGAIAWVAAKNHTPVIILRAVSDLVGEAGDPTYGNATAWQQAAETLMHSLVELLGEALPDLLTSATAAAR